MLKAVIDRVEGLQKQLSTAQQEQKDLNDQVRERMSRSREILRRSCDSEESINHDVLLFICLVNSHPLSIPSPSDAPLPNSG